MANLATFLFQYNSTPKRVLYREFIEQKWVDFEAGQIIDLVCTWQALFRSAGLKPQDRIAICLKNSAQWVACDQAILGMGLVCVPLYVDDNPSNINYCIAHSKVRLVVVENDRIARSLLQGGLQQTRVLCLKIDMDQPNPLIENAISLLEEQKNKKLDFEVCDIAPHTLATICYTSGTSGRPKGVMLSHNNIISNVNSCFELNIAKPNDIFLSFLPLSHMFERTGGYYLPLRAGAKVIYSRGTNQLAEDLVTQKPTVFFAVPRIFEKIYKHIQSSIKQSPFKQKAFNKLVQIGWKKEQEHTGILDRLCLFLLRIAVARPILERLGGRVRLAVVGGAALDSAISKTFIAMGLPILHGYGMTEASPVVSVNRPESNEPESVGPTLPGVKVKLGQNNELWVKGDNVMLGYWQDPQATQNAINSEGYLQTGDVAEIKNQKIYIRGRTKDILVLSNGEKFSPQDAEMAILSDAVFEQIVLIGEGKSFITLIAVTKHLDEKELIKRANERLQHLPRYIRVRRIILTQEAWTVENGLLTATLKVKRTKVIETFKDKIDEIYA